MKHGQRQSALLTHDDVITLFHEFGHGLHHMLTQVNERQVSGISGVEWDAVELPSQFMENFCWEWDVLRHMTSHVDTGEPLPRALFDKMLAARNYQSGMQTLRQIEFALFDMLLHTAHRPDDDVMALLEQVRQEVAVLRPPPWSRTPNTFSHIFAGGYAAGYYSYKWAEVLSADAYAAFEEAADGSGLPDRKPGENTGKPFWKPAAAARPWNRSRRSAAASRHSMPCCATRAWPGPARVRILGRIDAMKNLKLALVMASTLVAGHRRPAGPDGISDRGPGWQGHVFGQAASHGRERHGTQRQRQAGRRQARRTATCPTNCARS